MGQIEKSEIDSGRAKYIATHPKNLTNLTRLRIALKELRELFPTRYKVRVRRQRKLKYDLQGYAYLAEPRNGTDPYFMIYIATAGKSWQSQFDTLIHEWAHIYTWDEVERKKESDHGPIWSSAYGKIYRQLVED